MSFNCNKNCYETAKKRAEGIVVCDSIGDKLLKDIDSFCPCNDLELINFIGLCDEDYLETLLDEDENNWTEISLPEVLCIPEAKPNIEQIMTVKAKVDIISQRVVRTPFFTESSEGPDGTTVTTLIENNEGTILTGRKLIIEGILRQTIIYTAAKSVQSVHAAHFDIPFSAFIVVEEDTPLNTKYKIIPCIEDIFVCAMNERQIFKNVTLFIKAVPINSCNPE